MEANQILPQVLRHLPAFLSADDVHSIVRGEDGRHYPTTLAANGRAFIWCEGEPGPYVPADAPEVAGADVR